METAKAKEIEEIIKNIDAYPSISFVVQEKGLLWRIAPEYAKDKAKELLKLQNQALADKLREVREEIKKKTLKDNFGKDFVPQPLIDGYFKAMNEFLAYLDTEIKRLEELKK